VSLQINASFAGMLTIFSGHQALNKLFCLVLAQMEKMTSIIEQKPVTLHRAA
jgi:hypothetical protein